MTTAQRLLVARSLHALLAAVLFVSSAMGVAAPVTALAQTPQARPLVQEVIVSGLHLRAAPDYAAKSLGQLPKGALVCVLRTAQPGWYEVTARLGGRRRTAFVAKGFIGDPKVTVDAAQAARVCG